MLRAFGFILLFFLLFSCQSQEALPKRTGQEYVPVQVGAYWEYAVTETVISQVGGQTNTFTELRVEVTDSIASGGDLTYVLHRWTRDQGSSDWTAAETWSLRMNTTQLVQQEGNLPYVKLMFPLTEGRSWNGNSLNNLGGTDACGDGSFACDMYVVSGWQKPFEIPGVISYEDAVTILENNEDDPIIGKDIRKTVYAKGIGWVYREDTHLEYCTVGDCIGQQVVENGRIVRQTLTAHGVAQ